MKQSSDSPSNINNPAQFQDNLKIKYFHKYKIIIDRNICPICGKIMNLIIHKPSNDNVIWRSHKKSNTYNIKINMLTDSVFKDFDIKMNVLYFLLYFYFFENLSINESLNKCNYFCIQIGVNNITAQSVSRIFC